MSSYAWILLATIALPLLLSFDRKVAFFRHWPRTLLASLAVGIPFLVWDALASWRGDWDFSAVRTWPMRLLGLPLEEILFFLLVPFACLFVWACVKAWIPRRELVVPPWTLLLAAVACLVLSIAAWPRFYTSTLLGFMAMCLLLMAGPGRRLITDSHFWLTQLACYIPFLVVNGLLTSIPVVTYSASAILGWRMGTIPVEDALYSFVLVGVNILLFEALNKRHERSAEPRAKKAIIVGAGLGGLAAAARLAHMGWEVTVFEANHTSGGKAGTLTQEGYRFDTGPSLLTLPQVFDELFAFCGENRADQLEFLALPDICAYFWPDGARLVARPAADGMARSLADVFREDEGRTKRYFRKAAVIHHLSSGIFLERSLHRAATYFSRSGLRGLWGLPRMALLTTMHRLHCRYFRDPRTIQLFDRLATYNGSNPYRTPGTLATIAHAEYGLGAYAVRGGIQSIPAAIEALARRKGASFRMGQAVERIEVEQGRVRGVRSGGQFYGADIVLSNADLHRTYADLLGLPDAPAFRAYRRREPSSSGLVFYWGVRAVFPELRVNNIFFSADYGADFRAIFAELRCPDDPTIYVNITSKIDAGDAPPGCENWFVLINAPRDAGQDWMLETQRMRRAAIAGISRALGRDIAPLIASESVMAPPDLARASGSPHGSLYGISSNTRLAAFLRHGNRHPDIAGLYLAGGSVHPGGGMPLVLQSARIAVDLVGHHEGHPACPR